MSRLLPVLLLAALPASAEDLCRADINSTELVVDRDALSATPGQATLRERVTGWPVRRLDRLQGKVPACDSQTLIAFLSNEVPEEEIAGYCLAPDPALGYVLAPGPRDYRGRCIQTTCERVNAARAGATSVAGTAADMATGRQAEQSRTEAVVHSSGAAILSGSTASLLSTLGGGAATAVTAALSAPALAGAAAVSVVAVGGAVYLCHEE